MAKLRLCLLILGMILNKVSCQAVCEYDGTTYANGDVLTFDCYEQTCTVGEWIPGDLDPSCCEHDGEAYEEGQTEAMDCSIHICMSGHWIETEDPDPDCKGMDDGQHSEENYMEGDHQGEGTGGIVIRVEQIVNEH